jgi:hypothetical protein
MAHNECFGLDGLNRSLNQVWGGMARPPMRASTVSTCFGQMD